MLRSNGASYPIEGVSRAIQPNSRIVNKHIVPHGARLTVELTSRSVHTNVAWDEEFESPAVAEKMRPVSATANEQVLDRLHVQLESESASVWRGGDSDQIVAHSRWTGILRICSFLSRGERCRAIDEGSNRIATRFFSTPTWTLG